MFAAPEDAPPPMRLLLLLMTLALTACERGQERRVVHVYNWSDYIGSHTLAEFERETGIRVVYDLYDGNEMLEAKLVAGRSGYDVVFPSARPYAARHLRSGLYRPLERERLPHWPHLDAEVLASLEDIDPGNRHLVPYLWGTTGLGVNLRLVRERLGGDPPASWSLLFDPANAERLRDCGLSVLDEEQEAFAAALLYLGRDPHEESEETIAAVAAAYAAIRPHLRYFHSSRYLEDLASGALCVAMAYSGDVLQARKRAEESGRSGEIAFLLPREGALRWIDVIAVPHDAPHPAEAHAFIDFLLRPAVIAAISAEVGYASGNRDAKPLLPPALREDPWVYPPEGARLIDPRILSPDTERARQRAFTAIKAGRPLPGR
jgi:putrescine transport system substrate-binding protein